MADDWNSKMIAEFRANQGRVGRPIVLMHHAGRRSGTRYVTPVMYLPDAQHEDVIYVFASNNGRPANPAWYHNLVDAGKGEVEIGAESYPVTVTEITGAERDRIYREQATRYPNFAEYASKLDGVRTVPVLALRRA